MVAVDSKPFPKDKYLNLSFFLQLFAMLINIFVGSALEHKIKISGFLLFELSRIFFKFIIGSLENLDPRFFDIKFLTPNDNRSNRKLLINNKRWNEFNLCSH